MENNKKKLYSIYKEEYPKLLSFCKKYVKSESAAEDLVQEAFIKAIKNSHKLNDKEKAAAWLYVILRNTAYNYLKKEKGRQGLFLQSDKPGQVLNIADWNPEFDTLLSEYTGLGYEGLMELIQKLPKDCSEVFLLRALDGYTYKEIASAMGITIRAVKNHLSMARVKLRLWYAQKTGTNPAPKKKNRKLKMLFWFLLFRQQYTKRLYPRAYGNPSKPCPEMPGKLPLLPGLPGRAVLRGKQKKAGKAKTKNLQRHWLQYAATIAALPLFLGILQPGPEISIHDKSNNKQGQRPNQSPMVEQCRLETQMETSQPNIGTACQNRETTKEKQTRQTKQADKAKTSPVGETTETGNPAAQNNNTGLLLIMVRKPL